MKLFLIGIICCLTLTVPLIVKQLTIKDNVDHLSNYAHKSECTDSSCISNQSIRNITEAEQLEEKNPVLSEESSQISSTPTPSNFSIATTEICTQTKEVGPCRGYYPRYYYDAIEGRCYQFIYGGCRGNKNNFERYSDCKRMCEEVEEEKPKLSEQRAPISTTTTSNTSTTTATATEVDLDKAKKICTQNKKVGPCHGYFPRYYYDPIKGMCNQFIYGGCHRNKNNFEKYSDCKRICEDTLKSSHF